MKTSILSVGKVLGQAAPQGVPASAVDRPNQTSPQSTVETLAGSRTATSTRHRAVWVIATLLVALLFAAGLAVRIGPPYRTAAVASYSTRLAALDAKLSRELTQQLRAAGLEFGTALVSVEPPACKRAVCLIKSLRRDNLILPPLELAVLHGGNGVWTFNGKGELASLQFSVDATEEMLQLAASAPPNFGQLPLRILTTESPALPTRLPQGQELEARLPVSHEKGCTRWLDFETGQCLTEPDYDHLVGHIAYRDWLRTNGPDLFVVTYTNGTQWLFTRRMVFLPVAEQWWEQATAEEILAQPAIHANLHPGRQSWQLTRSRTNTFFFQTEAGTCGIVRLPEFNPTAPVFTIRYKLVAPDMSASTETEAL